MTTLVTGVAGFIGFHFARALLARGASVIGVDNINDYYDVALKEARVDLLREEGGSRFTFLRLDFSDALALGQATASSEIDRIVHLGAQAGVRYSLENPGAYIQANIVGHANLMELARRRQVSHFVYASSSSVYGGNKSLPFRVEDNVDRPISLYAATKRADELMTETYAHLYRLPSTGLRFFTVYGPWGRPDMAMWLFTQAILDGRPIPVFNHGRMRRDFTYVDDIVAGILAVHDNPPEDDGQEKAGGSRNPHRLYNIGNNHPEDLLRMIGIIEAELGRKAHLDLKPMQPGDVPASWADIAAIVADLGFSPRTSIDVGVPRFIRWFRDYHGLGHRPLQEVAA
jgi:UDP-glucuronate 4-epimerase